MYSYNYANVLYDRWDCRQLCWSVWRAKRTNKSTGEVAICSLYDTDELIKILDWKKWYMNDISWVFVELTLIQFIIAGELLDVCAINDNGDAKIIKASKAVAPKSGPQGT